LLAIAAVVLILLKRRRQSSTTAMATDEAEVETTEANELEGNDFAPMDFANPLSGDGHFVDEVATITEDAFTAQAE
jgi:high-affinity K+ transport system ATPase subunit B